MGEGGGGGTEQFCVDVDAVFGVGGGVSEEGGGRGRDWGRGRREGGKRGGGGCLWCGAGLGACVLRERGGGGGGREGENGLSSGRRSERLGYYSGFATFLRVIDQGQRSMVHCWNALLCFQNRKLFFGLSYTSSAVRARGRFSRVSILTLQILESSRYNDGVRVK